MSTMEMVGKNGRLIDISVEYCWKNRFYTSPCNVATV